MKRQVAGLSQASDSSANGLLEGLFLVRVVRVDSRWYSHKPYLLLHFTVLEPRPCAGSSIVGRLYCTPKALWKLNWFLRDFGYDTELLERDEIDNKQLIGPSGVVQITHTFVSGALLLNLEAFAPASQWEELSTAINDQLRRKKAAS